MTKNYQPLLDFITKISTNQEQTITIDTPLFEQKVINSMNILDIIGYVEKKLNRKLTDDELVMSNFKTIKIITDTFL